jgi:hypothetical protein
MLHDLDRHRPNESNVVILSTTCPAVDLILVSDFIAVCFN